MSDNEKENEVKVEPNGDEAKQKPDIEGLLSDLFRRHSETAVKEGDDAEE